MIHRAASVATMTAIFLACSRGGSNEEEASIGTAHETSDAATRLDAPPQGTATSASEAGCPTGLSVPVLLFHSICDGPCAVDDIYGIPAAELDQILSDTLASGYESISIDAYHRLMHGDTTGAPKRPLLVTFDDGRADAYANADPVLARHGVRATMFIIADAPGEGNSYYMSWTDVVAASASGRWDIQLHAYAGHTHVQVGVSLDGGSVLQPFYAWRRCDSDAGQFETFAQWKTRAESDIETGIQTMTQHVPGYVPTSFAVPYGDYGQLSSNDPAIAPELRAFLDAHFISWFTQPVSNPPFATASATHEAWRYTMHYTTTAADVAAWLAAHSCSQ
jgi:peptidoglycan/xylan/chitin deacetylase (PgdA/CDA1 family)